MWIAYVATSIITGIVVGALIYSRIREGCIGGTLSSITSIIITWAIIAFVIPHQDSSDSYPAGLWALMLYLAIAGATGLIFGSGLGRFRRRL